MGTLVLDTVGTLIDYMSTSIMNSGAQGVRTKGGQMSQTGWGVLKVTFGLWIAALRQGGKQVVMIGHDREKDQGTEGKTIKPDISGGSYAHCMRAADLVGFLSYKNDVRFLTWEPTDRFFAKNGGGLKSEPVPDFAKVPNYLELLIAEAKRNLGMTASASAEIARVVKEMEEQLSGMSDDGDLPRFNLIAAECRKLPSKQAMIQCGAVIQAQAIKHKWTLDKQTKLYIPAPPPAQPTQPPNPASDPKLAEGII